MYNYEEDVKLFEEQRDTVNKLLEQVHAQIDDFADQNTKLSEHMEATGKYGGVRILEMSNRRIEESIKGLSGIVSLLNAIKMENDISLSILSLKNKRINKK